MNERATLALREIMYRNPQRCDVDGYLLDLAAWGLEIKKERPAPRGFGQDVVAGGNVNSFIEEMEEVYVSFENEFPRETKQ